MQRIVLVGCGFMGRMHANVYKLLPNAEVVGWVDRRPERAEAMATEFGGQAFPSIEAALEQTGADVLDVCLPTDLHCEATLTGARAGKHVVCEKPMALSVEDADRMIAACDEAGTALMIGHCIRYWPEYAYLKELIDSKRLGELQVLHLSRYGEFPSWASDNWQSDESRAGGGVLDMHIHDTDFALYALGEPDEVISRGQSDHRGAGYAVTTMTFGQRVAHVEGGWSWPPKTPFNMSFRAMFERGAAIMEGGPLTIYAEGQEPEVVEFEAMSAEGGGNLSSLGGYYNELKDFVDCLEAGERPSVVTPETSRESLRVCLEEIRQIKG